MAKNLVSGQILAPLAQIWVPKFFSRIFPLLDVRHCCKLKFHSISMKTNKPNLRKWKKNLVLGQILAYLTKFGMLIVFFLFVFFFSKNLAPSVTRYHCQLSLCAKSEKTNGSILRELSDGRTDGQTDWHADGQRTQVIS